MLKDLLAWPEEFLLGSTYSTDEPDLYRAIWLFRQSSFQEMEALIFAMTPDDISGDFYFLYVYSLFWRNEKDRFLSSFKYFLRRYQDSCNLSPVLSSLAAIVNGEFKKVEPILDSMVSCKDKYSLCLVHLIKCYSFLVQGQISAAKHILKISSNLHTIESTILEAKILKTQLEFDQAVKLLDRAIENAPNNFDLHVELITALHSAKRGDRVLRDVKRAIDKFGFHPALMGHLAPLKLLQREPARALSSSLKERSFNSISNKLSKATNLFVAYEHSGHSNWSIHVCPDSILSPSVDPEFYANRCLQLASCGSSDFAVAQAQKFIQNTPSISSDSFALPSFNNKNKLKVVWLTGDCTNHPVARFLLGFFSAANSNFLHDHTLISTVHHRQTSWISRFRDLKNLKTLEFDDSQPLRERLDYLRSQRFDVAIDLSGWTGGNSLKLFRERFALVQVNYLGYFASTGLNNMDFWLGDINLFPKPCLEKHTEAIYRLPRSFIAWQPVPQMPEFNAIVSKPPVGPLRIGTFNHNRKFSDYILTIWAILLKRLPDAKIVFKASNLEDPHTKDLLYRRFARAELDISRIEWLPITKTAEEHLEQYSNLDISLDCYPNGGCTTTCEALWMGVPSVTLAGDTYVSRMSTAVLKAANLSRFVAQSADEYCDIVCREVQDLQHFRSQRHLWRERLRSSQLGNSKDLFTHLENAFLDMVSIKYQVMTG